MGDTKGQLNTAPVQIAMMRVELLWFKINIYLAFPERIKTVFPKQRSSNYFDMALFFYAFNAL